MSRTSKTPATTEENFEFTPEKVHQLVYRPYAEPKKMYANRDAVATWFSSVAEAGRGRVTNEFLNLQKKLRNHGLSHQAWSDNKQYNRYNDMACFDCTRVKLQDGLLPDYIHANYVDGYQRPKSYILTQGPLDHTVVDFWRMIWQEKTATIVMLARFEEAGKPKCAKYIPLTSQTDLQAGPFRLSLVQYDARRFCHGSLIRIVNMLDEREIRYVVHIWFPQWPDRGVPDDPNGLRAFLNYTRVININMSQTLSGPQTHHRGPPIVYHCSAGIGRSAVCILLDVFTENLNHNDFVEPLELVNQLRTQRYHSVHTKDQLLFTYDFIVQLLKHGRYSLLVDADAPRSGSANSR